MLTRKIYIPRINDRINAYLRTFKGRSRRLDGCPMTVTKVERDNRKHNYVYLNAVDSNGNNRILYKFDFKIVKASKGKKTVLKSKSFIQNQAKRASLLDRIQVSAFESLFKTRITPDDSGRKVSNEEAFVSAILDTSDDAFEERLRTNPKLMEKFITKYSVISR